MSRRGRRLLIPLVRRLLPGAPVGGQVTVASRELAVAGADGSPIPVTDEGQGPAVLCCTPAPPTGRPGPGWRRRWRGASVLRFDR
jgi:hypothetical protein